MSKLQVQRIIIVKKSKAKLNSEDASQDNNVKN